MIIIIIIIIIIIQVAFSVVKFKKNDVDQFKGEDAKDKQRSRFAVCLFYTAVELGLSLCGKV